MNVYKVEFKGVYPVPCGLIVAANSKEEAAVMARDTIKHTDDFEVEEVCIAEPGVIFYESGEY